MEMNDEPQKPIASSELDPKLLRVLQSSLTALEFGSVILKVHEGKVVQVERVEKIRIR
jgi:hypothetical protein